MTHDHLASLQHQDNLQSYPMYTVQLFCLERLLNTALHALCIAGIVHHMHLGCLQPQLLSPQYVQGMFLPSAISCTALFLKSPSLQKQQESLTTVRLWVHCQGVELLKLRNTPEENQLFLGAVVLLVSQLYTDVCMNTAKSTDFSG